MICDNDGVGITEEEGAKVILTDCTVERNGLAPTKNDEVAFSLPAEPALISSH